jgi:hypothetical protein
MALGELNGRNLASAFVRSRVHNRTRDRGGKPVRLAWPWAFAPPPVLPEGPGALSQKNHRRQARRKAASRFKYAPRHIMVSTRRYAQSSSIGPAGKSLHLIVDFRAQLIANRNELDRAHAEQTAPAMNGKRHRIPNSFIQQESELTSVNSPCQQLPRAWGSDGCVGIRCAASLRDERAGGGRPALTRSRLPAGCGKRRADRASGDRNDRHYLGRMALPHPPQRTRTSAAAPRRKRKLLYRIFPANRHKAAGCSRNRDDVEAAQLNHHRPNITRVRATTDRTIIHPFIRCFARAIHFRP